MTSRSASGSVLGTQFDQFLLASVFEERNGPLSVLSALARVDVDPWDTAATLSQLPRQTAAQELAVMFAGLPDGPPDRDVIAERVVALLPSPAGAQAVPPGALASSGRQASGPHGNFALLCVVSMLIALLVQDLVLSHQTGQGASAAAVVSPRQPSATP